MTIQTMPTIPATLPKLLEIKPQMPRTVEMPVLPLAAWIRLRKLRHDLLLLLILLLLLSQWENVDLQLDTPQQRG